MGKALKTRPGWRLGILTSDAVLAGQMRLPLRPRFATSNGGIPVSFLVSEKAGKAQPLSAESRSGGEKRGS
jgi:hypothetical protein